MPTFQDPYDNEDYLNTLSGCSVSGGSLLGTSGVAEWTALSTNLGSEFSSDSIDSIQHTSSKRAGVGRLQFSSDGSSFVSEDGSDLNVGSYEFDGINDWIEVPNHVDIADNFWEGGGTISFWAKPYSDGGTSKGTVIRVSNNDWIIDFRNEAAGFLDILFFHGTNNTGVSKVTNYPLVPINEWVHVVVSWNRDNHTTEEPAMYVNGVLATFDPNTPSGTADAATGSNLNIGGREGSVGYHGLLSDVIMWRSALTTQQKLDIFLLGNIPSGYTARWRMEGDATEDNGIGDGTVSGATVSTEVPLLGHNTGNEVAKHFDGINDYINIPSHVGLEITGDMSFFCWCKVDSTSPAEYLISMSASGETQATNYNYAFGVATDGDAYYFHERGNGSNVLLNPLAIMGTDDEWQHVGFTRDVGAGDVGAAQTTIKIYHNGQLVYTSSLVNNPDGGSSCNPALGGLYNGGAYYHGLMCHAAVWGDTRTDEEILADYLNVAPVDTGDADLISYWPLIDDFADAVGPNDGTNSGVTEITDISGPSSKTEVIDLSSLSLVNDFYYKILAENPSLSQDPDFKEITVSYTSSAPPAPVGDEVKNLTFAASSGDEVAVNSRDWKKAIILSSNSSANCTLRENTVDGDVICYIPSGKNKLKAPVIVAEGVDVYVEGSANLTLVFSWSH